MTYKVRHRVVQAKKEFVVLPSETRHRVDAIWDRIWASGVSNPLTAIEYFSTVLLLRRLSDRPIEGAGVEGDLWYQLDGYVAAGDSAAVAGLMQRVQRDFGIGASPDVASVSTWRDLATLRHVMREVLELKLQDRNHDILGDLFEYMLSHLSTAGQFGQFRTPRHLIKFIVQAVDPKPGEVVVDPAVGTAGFLIAAHEHRRGTSQDPYIGNEVDATIARVAQTNVLLHGMAGSAIRHEDSLLTQERDADVILANPPFAGSVVADRVVDFSAGTLKTELLFLELMMKRLRPGGRAGVVIPTGVLTSSSAAAVWVRRQLLESNHLRAVVELPSGVFRPYTDVKTAVLFWSNETPTDDVLLIRCQADGYSLDDKRVPLDADDLPGALRLLQSMPDSVPHIGVSASEIAGNGYNLSPTRYVQAESGSWTMDDVSLQETLSACRLALSGLDEELANVERLIR